MKMQHLLALMEGYLSGGDLEGEYDYRFRHRWDDGRILLFTVTATRHPESHNWQVVIDADDPDHTHFDQIVAATPQAALATLKARLPDWGLANRKKS